MKLTWPYIAGFFDGEGCVTCYQIARPKKKTNNGVVNVVASIAQSGKEGLFLFGEMKQFFLEHGIKCGIGNKKDKIATGHHRAMYSLRITSRSDVTKFLSAIFPFLSIKKVPAQDGLRFLKIFPSLQGLYFKELNTRNQRITREELVKRFNSGESLESISLSKQMQKCTLSSRISFLRKHHPGLITVPKRKPRRGEAIRAWELLGQPGEPTKTIQ